ncbi:MAG: gamma-glutamylcyclotransferase [Alphaproteobacteria bacterium]|nr:gamma-glutamylcyclotransferase [Alphaproteobacteria bacterium]
MTKVAKAMRFFFYGTLLEGSGNAVARALQGRLRPVAPASVKGALFAIPDPHGWYPALVPDGQGTVQGTVSEALASFTDADLARMDALEDYDPARPDLSLYVRRAVMLDGGGEAQAYVWNRPLPGDAIRIPQGDFRRWLAETGFREFADPAGS